MPALVLAGIVRRPTPYKNLPNVGIYKLAVRSFEAWQRGILYSRGGQPHLRKRAFDLGAVFLLPCWTHYLNVDQEDITEEEEGTRRTKRIDFIECFFV